MTRMKVSREDSGGVTAEGGTEEKKKGNEKTAKEVARRRREEERGMYSEIVSFHGSYISRPRVWRGFEKRM